MYPVEGVEEENCLVGGEMVGVSRRRRPDGSAWWSFKLAVRRDGGPSPMPIC